MVCHAIPIGVIPKNFKKKKSVTSRMGDAEKNNKITCHAIPFGVTSPLQDQKTNKNTLN